MLPENELLQYVHKTADMGCIGLEAVLDQVQAPALQQLLKDQHAEYRKLRKQAARLLYERGEDAGEVPTMAKLSSNLMAAGKLLADPTDEKIAEMTIQGNNMGVTKTLKHLHDYAGRDKAVRALTETLLATEERNAKQLQPFL